MPRSAVPRAAPDPVPGFQLATLVSEVPVGPDWLYELKLDGYRLACRRRGDEVRLVTRGGHDWSRRFRAIVDAARTLPLEDFCIDGEAVVFDETGVSRFEALQQTLKRPGAPIIYMAFDCLSLGAVDLRGEPLVARKRALARLVGRGRRGAIRYVDHVTRGGPEILRDACRHGAEGVVAKRRDAPYEARRSRSWLKIRCGLRQELVVAGFTEPQGSRVGLGALLLGVYGADGRLHYAGRVGSGFDDADLTRLRRRLEALAVRGTPFATPLSAAERRGVRFVEPRLVAEVRFTEWTAQRRLRQPVFLGLRDDKRATDVVREEARGAAAP